MLELKQGLVAICSKCHILDQVILNRKLIFPVYLIILVLAATHYCKAILPRFDAKNAFFYYSQSIIFRVDANFDKYDIPMDVIWLDIEHTDGKR